MSNSTISSPQWDPAWVFPQQTTLVNAAVACLGYGCFFVLAINAIRAVLHAGLYSLARRALLAAVLMFLVSSTVECAAKFTFELANLATGPYNDNISAVHLVSKMNIVIVIFDRINYVLNDVLVVWRAWVLADQRILRVVLAVSMLITICCAIAEAVRIFQAGVLDFGTVALTANLLLFVPLVFNNLLATTVILYKTWIYRTEIKKDLHQTSQRTQIESVLFLLVESGFIYCGWWLIFLVAKYVHSVPLMMYYVIAALAPFSAAIYPMLIILVVDHQKSRASQTTVNVPTRSLRFTEASAESEAGFSIVQSIVDIQSGQTIEQTRRSSPKKYKAGIFDRRASESKSDPDRLERHEGNNQGSFITV